MSERLLLRDILKKYGIQHKTIAEALGLNRINLNRYDDLMDRPLKEVILISEATGISFMELTGIDKIDTGDLESMISEVKKNVKSDDTELIYSLQKTIQALEETVKTKNELIEILKK